MKRMLVAVSAILIVLHSHAAFSQLTGPVLGYMFDTQDSAIRVIKGIPGASALGKPIEIDLKIQKAVVSVEHDYALAVLDGTGDIVIISNLSRTPSVSQVSGVDGGADAFAISPDGDQAVVYQRERSLLQVIAGLPSDPLVRFEAETASFAQQSLTALAINRDGQILAAFTDGEFGSVYLLGPGTSPRLVARVGSASSISFPMMGDLAVVVDRAANQVLLLQYLSTVASAIQLASQADGISDPIGILLSRDSKTAYVANAGSGSVTAINLAGGTSRDLACNCKVTTMRELRGGSVFALTDRADQPVVVFDGRGEDPGFVLIPPYNDSFK